MHILIDIVRSQQADDPFAFQLGRQEYIGRTASGSIATATLDWDDKLMADLAALRRPQPDPALVQRVGDRLQKFLAELGFHDEKALIAGTTIAGERVAITMRLYAAELFALPWELFTLRVEGQHAGALPRILFRYCWPESQTLPEVPCPRKEGGRILFAWSAAAGPVPAAQHQSAIAEAAELGNHPFSVEKDVVPHVSIGRLRTALLPREGEQPVTVLHILCHGVPLGPTIGLSWDAEDGGGSSHVVDGNQLRDLLRPFASHLRLVVLCACNSGNLGVAGNHLGSPALVLHRAGLASIIASRFPLSVEGSCLLTEVLYRTLLEQTASLETAFTTARQRLVMEPESLDWACLQLYARPEDGEDTRPIVLRPYRGLAAFLPKDRRFFFGREAEWKEAISDLEALRQGGKPRFLVVAGASGTGKSSVVLAGMLPALLKTTTAALLPDKSRKMVASLIAELDQGQPGPLLQGALEALRRAMSTLVEDGGAWAYAVMRPGSNPEAALALALACRKDDSRPFLLVVDQLEEIFTHTADPAARRDFVKRLWSLSQGNTGVCCVVTLRVDFLGQCAEVPLDELGLRLDRVAYDEAHRVFVAQMGVEQLRTVITRPAELVGLLLEEGLAAQMIADVEGEPGALPLLEYVLDLLWQQRDGRKLTLRAYRELGGVVGALGGNAERLYAQLDPEAKQLARRLLVRLVSRGDVLQGDARRRAPLAELRAQVAGSGAVFDSVVAEFVDARLLVRSEAGGQLFLEVAHEALLRKWQELRAWLEEDRQMLGEIRKLEAWAEQCASDGTWLRGPQLGFAREVLQRHRQDIGPKVIAMVENSVAAQRLWWGQVAAFVVLSFLLLSGLTGWALRSRKKAHEAADAATASMLTLQAEHVLRRDPAQSLLLAAHAAWLKDDSESQGALATALTASAGVKAYLRGPKGKITALAFSRDGEWLAAGGEDGVVFLYDARSGASKKRLLRPVQTTVSALAFSPDRRFLVAAEKGPSLWLWELDREAPPVALQASAPLLDQIDFSPDGRFLAAVDKRQRIVAWNLGVGLKPAFIWPAERGNLSTLRFFPGPGTRLAAGTTVGSVKLFDVAQKVLLQELRGEQSLVEDLDISPDGTWLLSSSGEEDAERWDLTSEPPKATRLSSLQGARDVFIQNDARLVLTCKTDGALLLVDGVTNQVVARPQPLHRETVGSCAESSDGRTVAVGSENEIVLWDLSTAHAASASAMAISPDGTTLAAGAPDGTIRFLDQKSGRTLGEPVHVHQGIVNGLVYRGDGQEVISVGGDGAIYRIDANRTRSPVLLAKPDLGTIMTVDHSCRGEHCSKGELLAIGTASGWLLLWDLASQPERELIRRPAFLPEQGAFSLSEVRFSPDGSTLASAGERGGVSRWRTSDLTRIGQPLMGLSEDEEIRSLDYSPDGAYLALAGSNRLVKLWNVLSPTPTVEGPPLKHSADVRRVRFSKDGTLLAVATGDFKIALWNSKTHQRFGAPLVGHGGPILTLLYTAEQLLFSGDSATIWRWNVGLSDGRTRACAQANRNFSQAEWAATFPLRPYCRLCAGLPAGDGALEDSLACGPP